MNDAKLQQSQPDDLAIYVHWPYCTRICPYCDFNVYKMRDDVNLVRAICDDLSYWRQWSGARNVTSIHFGGGTPSLLSPYDIQKIIQQIRSLWTMSSQCEIALEANPNDASLPRWQAYAAAGINRVSLGLQSFHDAALRLLGRDHSAAEAKAALRLASEIFPRVSADLIYGWAGQDDALLKRDLDILLQSGIGHISAYQLTIEDGTAFGKALSRGDNKAVDSDKSADFYEDVRNVLIASGFNHYEVSNFAKAGQASEHNLAYWQGRDYVGVGPGAHGRMTLGGKRYATIAALRPDDHQKRIAAHGTAIDSQATLTPQAWGEEYILMGLRIDEGVSLSRFTQITGQNLSQDTITMLIKDGLLRQEDDRLMATSQGRLILNSVTDILLLAESD